MLNSRAIAEHQAAREGSRWSRPSRGRGGCKAFPRRPAHGYLAHDLRARLRHSHRVSLRPRECVCDIRCCGRIMLCDIASYGFEVLDRLVEPPDPHSGGLCSFRVPQVASQASTSSWLTKRAPRLFALFTASRIALVCHSLRAIYILTASAASQALERPVASASSLSRASVSASSRSVIVFDAARLRGFMCLD